MLRESSQVKAATLYDDPLEIVTMGSAPARLMTTLSKSVPVVGTPRLQLAAVAQVPLASVFQWVEMAPAVRIRLFAAEASVLKVTSSG
ncbi:MAG: hypothetical protein BWX80_02483 [Candidatus Hydrogenedentes bacterium ADurb.Bin101]|nr:MAG: hypothetical protein BWX80_02483 [Candidatus Hydrogenedentes bacterium ADurb.Bin101]